MVKEDQKQQKKLQLATTQLLLVSSGARPVQPEAHSRHRREATAGIAAAGTAAKMARRKRRHAGPAPCMAPPAGDVRGDEGVLGFY